MRHLFLLALMLAIACRAAAQSMPTLRVAPAGHHLEQCDGTPFFYLGDTAWELLHTLSREEIELYLTDRALKGFNVIQTVILAQHDGLFTPNAYGHLPFVDADPMRPAVVDGPDNDYWDFVDHFVCESALRGIYCALLPTWGTYWTEHPIFTEESARAYARFLAERYRRYPIIWILGGDRNPETDAHKAIISAMAQGIRDVHAPHLITCHTAGWNGSARYFHGAPWMDFHGRQNSHNRGYAAYALTRDDFVLTAPTCPVIDLEPLYEGTLSAYDDADGPSVQPADVRRALYWDVFCGSAGVAYGHSAVWCMNHPSRPFYNAQLPTWTDALDAPVAHDAARLRRFMEQEGFGTLSPAPDGLLAEDIASMRPVPDTCHQDALYDASARRALIYSPQRRSVTLRGAVLGLGRRFVTWFSPSSGRYSSTKKCRSTSTFTLTPPAEIEGPDVVAIIECERREHAPLPTE